MSLEELQEALDEVETIVWATCEWGSLGREKMNVLMNKFAAYRAEQEKKDKQLSELMKRQPLPEAFQWISDFVHWTKKLKELLEK